MRDPPLSKAPVPAKARRGTFARLDEGGPWVTPERTQNAPAAV